MFYDGKFGKSLVSDEFNQLCTDCHVEASVRPFPNPGNPSMPMRVVIFRNFNQREEVKVTQFNEKKEVHLIPAKGELQIMLKPGEQLPHLERIICPTTL